MTIDSIVGLFGLYTFYSSHSAMSLFSTRQIDQITVSIGMYPIQEDVHAD